MTYLPAAVTGRWFHLYLILDLFSRKIVGWEVHDSDHADHAAHVAKRTALAEGIAAMFPKPVLHGDNGSTVKGTTVLAMLEWLLGSGDELHLLGVQRTQGTQVLQRLAFKLGAADVGLIQHVGGHKGRFDLFCGPATARCPPRRRPSRPWPTAWSHRSPPCWRSARPACRPRGSRCRQCRPWRCQKRCAAAPVHQQKASVPWRPVPGSAPCGFGRFSRSDFWCVIAFDRKLSATAH